MSPNEKPFQNGFDLQSIMNVLRVNVFLITQRQCLVYIFFGRTSEITFVASRYHKAIKSTVDEKQFQATYDEEAFSEVKR